MDAQADFGLRCLHMPEDRCSQGAAHLQVINTLWVRKCRLSSIESVHEQLCNLQVSLFTASSHVLSRIFIVIIIIIIIIINLLFLLFY